MMIKQPMYQGLVVGDTAEGEVPCGQNAGMIKDILSAQNIISNIIKNIPSIMEEVKIRLS